MSTPEETQSHTYDPFGRLDAVTEAKGAAVRVTDTDYDAEGRTVRVSRPEGAIEYAYDQATGRMSKVFTANTEVQYGYDVLGRLLAVTESKRAGATLGTPLVTGYVYDLVGNASKVTVTEGAGGPVRRETTNGYDPLRHWLVGVSNKAGGVVVSTFDYTRRADGQITQVVETAKQSTGVTVSTTAAYTYDALDRLTKEAVTTNDAANGGYAIQYVLDRVGNRLQKVRTGSGAETTASTYDERDRLTKEVVTGGANPGTMTYGHDANGSLTTQSGPQPRTQSWDARGRMTGATVGGVTTSYAYTPDGVRSAVTEGATTTLYVIDAMSPSGYAQVVEERTASGLYVASTVYGSGLDPISTSRVGQATGLYLADGHSGVRQVAGLGGAVLQALRYDAYGATVSSNASGGFVNPVGYRGKRYDATLGQYYLRARYYDPRQGRFTGMDPFMGNMGDPSQVMRYGYGGANPVGSLDPTGMFSVTGFFSGNFSGLLNAVNWVSRASNIVDRVITFVEFVTLIAELANGNIPRAIQQAVGEAVRNLPGSGPPIPRSLNLNDIREVLQHLIGDVPAIARAVSINRNNLSWIANARHNKSNHRIIIFLPDISGGRYSGELARIPVPRVMLNGIRVEASFGRGGGRLFGIGLRRLADTKTGHQLIRVDYHVVKSFEQDPRFVHDPRFRSFFEISNGTRFHWQVPDNDAAAKVTWPFSK